MFLKGSVCPGGGLFGEGISKGVEETFWKHNNNNSMVDVDATLEKYKMLRVANTVWVLRFL